MIFLLWFDKKVQKDILSTLICIITILCKNTSLSSWDCLYSHRSIVKRKHDLKTCVWRKKTNFEEEKLCAFFPYFFFSIEKKTKQKRNNRTKNWIKPNLSQCSWSGLPIYSSYLNDALVFTRLWTKCSENSFENGFCHTKLGFS